MSVISTRGQSIPMEGARQASRRTRGEKRKEKGKGTGAEPRLHNKYQFSSII